jgi:predicted RNA-binding Zn ribbon-like protein
MSEAELKERVPGAARLLRDFVNTVEWQEDEEAWSSPSDLAAWLRENVGEPVGELGDVDLVLARRIREGLREILLTHAGHEALPGAVADLNEAMASVPLRLAFDEVGRATLSGAQSGAGVLAPIVIAIDAARADGSWTRLKACSRDSCRWAYWDGSRNRSGRWCAMEGCGNYIKMRRRNSPEASAQDALPLADSGTPRVSRMVDVAARAGVSIKTVSNVVTGAATVSPATRMRVEAAIEELDYRPNLVARALRTGRDAAVS